MPKQQLNPKPEPVRFGAGSKNFLSSTDFDFKDKSVLLRIDCDVDLRRENGELVVDEDFRLRVVLPTIRLLQDKGCKKITLLGHIGRPGGKPVADLSLKPVADWFCQRLDSCRLVDNHLTIKPSDHLILFENLRFDPGEKSNDKHFVAELASHADVYVNDAFGVSHRDSASIVGLPKLLPSFLGLRIEAEIETISWIKKQAKRPLIFVLGGSKKGKLNNISFLTEWVDQFLVGGKLPTLIEEQKIKINNKKVVLAELKKSGRDLTDKSIEEFKQIIRKAKTIIWAGPMGVYEETGNKRGTFEVAKAIAEMNGVFKLAGGGDTHRVLSWTNLWDKFDFVSVGGGALLQFLKDGTLPGIKAITRSLSS